MDKITLRPTEGVAVEFTDLDPDIPRDIGKFKYAENIPVGSYVTLYLDDDREIVVHGDGWVEISSRISRTGAVPPASVAPSQRSDMKEDYADEVLADWERELIAQNVTLEHFDATVTIDLPNGDTITVQGDGKITQTTTLKEGSTR